MRILFKNENIKLRISITDSEGIKVPASLIGKVEVKLYGETTNKVWLHYTLPKEDNTKEIQIENDEYIVEITTSDVSKAPLTEIILQVTYQIIDNSYSEGFRQITEKGKILIIKDVL